MKPPQSVPLPRIDWGFLCKEPTLIGVATNGDLVNLDGGVIRWQPSGRISFSMDRGKKPEVQMGRDFYSLTFSKPNRSPWNAWFEENPDLRFKIGEVRFAITSMAKGARQTKYVAGSIS